MQRLLVTGGSGFLGSALARFWAERGHEIHLLVRPSSSLVRVSSLLDCVAVHTAATPYEAASVVRAVAPDVIVHTACAYGRAGETPQQILESNVLFGSALLQAVCEGARRVNFLSTGSALEPYVSLYALTKRQFADWGAQLARRSPEQLRFIDLKLQHMYGPGDDRSKFTSYVLQSLHDDVPRLDLTAGEQERDLIHVDDVVSAYDTVLANAANLPTHDTIEIGTGKAPRVRDFVELVQRLTGSSTHLAFGTVPYRQNEAMRCIADTARLRAFGWHPMHDIESGLINTLQKEFHS